MLSVRLIFFLIVAAFVGAASAHAIELRPTIGKDAVVLDLPDTWQPKVNNLPRHAQSGQFHNFRLSNPTLKARIQIDFEHRFDPVSKEIANDLRFVRYVDADIAWQETELAGFRAYLVEYSTFAAPEKIAAGLEAPFRWLVAYFDIARNGMIKVEARVEPDAFEANRDIFIDLFNTLQVSETELVKFARPTLGRQLEAEQSAQAALDAIVQEYKNGLGKQLHEDYLQLASIDLDALSFQWSDTVRAFVDPEYGYLDSIADMYSEWSAILTNTHYDTMLFVDIDLPQYRLKQEPPENRTVAAQPKLIRQVLDENRTVLDTLGGDLSAVFDQTASLIIDDFNALRGSATGPLSADQLAKQLRTDEFACSSTIYLYPGDYASFYVTGDDPVFADNEINIDLDMNGRFIRAEIVPF